MVDISTGQTWSAGDKYEPYVGRWSRLVAREFIAWLEVDPSRRWLDVGSGTGALTETILAMAEPAAVTGVDPAEGFVAHARDHISDPRADFLVADAMALPVEDRSRDAAVSGLVLNFVPDASVVVAEMRRVCVDGGTVAAYVWDYAGRMQLMRYFWDAAIEINPAAMDADEGRRFPICREGALGDVFRAVGLESVEETPIEVATIFRDFDDYWLPFLGGQAPAPAYLMSLPESEQAELRELVRSKLPVAADGSIAMVARAWAVKGRR